MSVLEWTKRKVWGGILLVLVLGGCASPEKVLYLQDVVQYKQQSIEEAFEVRIHKDDLLSIVVAV
jgi:polysaccharide export outer membrane protein